MTVYSGTNAGSYLYCYDGNGNVAALVNAANGAIAAQYEYGPFGELIRATGPMAKLNPFMFSTKFYDWEAGLYYYGCRYYNPSTGRWLSRDPAGEQMQAMSLYHISANDFVNKYDYMGLLTGTLDEDDSAKRFPDNDGFDFKYRISGLDPKQFLANSPNAQYVQDVGVTTIWTGQRGQVVTVKWNTTDWWGTKNFEPNDSRIDHHSVVGEALLTDYIKKGDNGKQMPSCSSGSFTGTWLGTVHLANVTPSLTYPGALPSITTISTSGTTPVVYPGGVTVARQPIIPATTYPPITMPGTELPQGDFYPTITPINPAPNAPSIRITHSFSGNFGPDPNNRGNLMITKFVAPIPGQYQ